MIGIDTNVLIRYIVQDDPIQSPLAGKFIEENCTKANPGFVSHIVLCELAWVLKRAYGCSKKVIVDVISQILSTAELRVEKSQCAWLALREFQSGMGGYSDYLIGVSHRQEGGAHTVTFDRKAAQSTYFSLLS